MKKKLLLLLLIVVLTINCGSFIVFAGDEDGSTIYGMAQPIYPNPIEPIIPLNPKLLP